MSEMFKPKQFDSFAKMPDDQKSNFKKEEDGSFVYKEAAQELSDAELTAKIVNELKDQKITSMDVLHKKALDMETNRQKYFKNLREGKYINNEYNFPKEAFQDKSFVLEMVKRSGIDLEHASPELKNDKEVVLAAISNTGFALEYASKELKNDKEVVLAAIEKNPEVIDYASPELQNDKEMVVTALRKDPSAIVYVKNKFLDDKDIMLEIVKLHPRAFRSASERLRSDKEVIVEAIKGNISNFEFVPEAVQKEIMNSLK